MHPELGDLHLDLMFSDEPGSVPGAPLDGNPGNEVRPLLRVEPAGGNNDGRAT